MLSVRNTKRKNIKSQIFQSLWIGIKHHCEYYTLQQLLLQILILTATICLLIFTFNDLLLEDEEFIGFDPDISESITLKLMSFNVRNQILDVNDSDETKHWDLRRKAVQKLFSDEQYDIIGTQEGTPSQIRDIADSLGHQHDHYGLGRLPSKWYGSSRDDMNEHCTIFWRHDKLQIFDYGTFWLSDIPNKMGAKYYNSPLPRIATWTMFDVNGNDKYQLLIVNTHLGLSEEIRNQQLIWIAKFIQDITYESTKELLVFVVGDFNEAIKGPLWSKLFEEEHATSVKVSDILTDCIVDYQEMNQRDLNVNFTYHAFEGLDHAKNDKNHAPIDWILCSKNMFTNNDIELKDVSIVTGSMSINEQTVYPSDHFPVVLELDLK